MLGMNMKSPSSVDLSHSLSSLSEFFRRSRLDAGFDISALANDAGVSVETIHALEIVPHKVPLQDLFAVANVLNLDPGVVLDFLHSATR